MEVNLAVKKRQTADVLRIMSKSILEKLSKPWTFKRNPPRKPH